MDPGWRSSLGGLADVSAVGALTFILIVSLLCIAGWFYHRQRREAGEALRESEARCRAMAVRMSRRHALTAALSQAVTPDGVAQAIVTEGRTLLGAQAGAVMRLVEHRTKLARLYSHGDAPQIPEDGHVLSLEPGLYSTETVTTERPVLVGSFAEWQKRYWRSASA